MGSANINDRSLLGTGDSELAVTIADTAHSMHDLDGTGTPAPCRIFARELRQNAWRKWMGSAAEECAEALDKPALKASWEKIRAIAKENTKIYDSVFNFIPRNLTRVDTYAETRLAERDIQDSDINRNIPASIWPVLGANKQIKVNDGKSMPFSEFFWAEYNLQPFKNRHLLSEINSYFTLLSTDWTDGEDNLIPYNMRLISSIEHHDTNEYRTAEIIKKDKKGDDFS